MRQVIMEGRKNYNDEEIQQIWEKAKMAKGKTSGKLLTNKRFDIHGALMNRDDYGDRDSEFGWEIDHKDEDPNNNDISNLRPLFWRNNLARNSDKPHYYSYNLKLDQNVLK